jgi:signal transduction histidine kinase
MSIVDQRTILIVSDDAEFPRQVAARWQSERMVPAFTVLGSDFRHGFDSEAFDVAVVGPLRRDAMRPALRALESSGKPVIVVSEESQTAQASRRESARVLAVSRNEGWPDTVVLVAIEILRRVDAVNRAERAEHVSALLKCHATLGQYVIEMRHTLNNALTSVLGNSELLLLEPGTFSAGVRSQIDTIRNMALRMHEILQRFSSLEKELTFVETQSAKERNGKAQAAVVGQ